jgi:NADH-quinone oxidoreductase subunit A
VLLSDYLPIVMLLGLGALFGGASILIASKVGPSNPTAAKLAPYECGITPERLPRERFPVKFYIVAMLFIIFDIEVIFFYPFAVIFRELGLFGLAEMGVFIGLLLVAYVYVWRGRGFDWEEEPSTRSAISRRMLDAAGRMNERMSA